MLVIYVSCDSSCGGHGSLMRFRFVIPWRGFLTHAGPRQSRLHVVCVCARGGGGGVSSQAHHRGHREEVWKPAYKFWDTRILPAKDNSGFMRDRYTLLPETRERIVATEVTAWWR
uniref:Uncharacterized protein n=1 Tax=Triticum urartu TaxID=4572 RepID=A0A8R7VL01_TRIUA